MGLLESLKETDLAVVASTTGNYAIAVSGDLQEVKAHKALLTLNQSPVFQEFYDGVIYLSHKFHSSSHVTQGIQNVYTRYGIGYFFDLLYNLYIEQYLEK